MDRSQPPADRPQVDDSDDATRYPTQHVLGVEDTPDALMAAVDQLMQSRFLDSEIQVRSGQGAADRLRASTGHTGLLDRVLRITRDLGLVWSELESEAREYYAEALQDGRFVVSVYAPSDERKTRAAECLRAHGGHFINYFGLLTIETIAP